MNYLMRPWFALSFLVVAGSNQVVGQEVAPKTYREVTDSRSVLTTPNGPISVGSTHDATIRFARVTPDSAVAYYEKLQIVASTPRGESRPDVSSALNQEFVLKFDDRGHVQTLVTPTFPTSLKGITDLRYQFFDFFPPIRGPRIAAGTEWSDTLVLRQDDPSTGAGETRKVTVFRVVGDTAVGGMSGWVISGSAVFDTKSSGPVDGQPGISVEVALRGPESNVFIVSKSDLSLISRVRSAELKGTMKYVGTPEPVQFDMVQSYTNEIRLVKAPN